MHRKFTPSLYKYLLQILYFVGDQFSFLNKQKENEQKTSSEHLQTQKFELPLES